MTNSSIKKLQSVDLNILKSLLLLFEKYDLEYYMLGGTMLGAIRHGGFIPWDDDIDIGMPRKDYEKFLDLAETELEPNLKIVNYRTDPTYHYYITRVLNTDTKVIELRYKKENKTTHAAIDVFPLDGTPNNKIKRMLFLSRIMMHRAMMSLSYKDTIIINANRGFVETLFLKMMKMFPTDKLFNSYKQKCIIDRLLRKYEMSSSLYTGNLMGAYRIKELFKTTVYGNKYYNFEGIQLRGLEDYDFYLKQLYNDYMKLPDEDEIKIHYEIVEV